MLCSPHTAAERSFGGSCSYCWSAGQQDTHSSALLRGWSGTCSEASAQLTCTVCPGTGGDNRSLGNLCSTRKGHTWKSCGNLWIWMGYWKGGHTLDLCERGKSNMTHKKKKICESVGYIHMQGLLSSLQ